MGRPELTLTENSLEITIDKGNKQWVAHITGTDDQYDLDREFISPYGQGTETVTLDDGAVVEKCYYSHGGREKGREYYVVVGGQLCEINEDDVERALEATVVAIDGDSGRTHQCKECGDEFDSAHGLSIHEGMVHSDDEDEAQVANNEPNTDAGSMLTAIADGGYERDEEAIIAVDWDAIETETGESYPDEMKRVVERTGNAIEYTLDKWGFAEYSETALSAGVREHGRLVHPERGPLSAEYLPLNELSSVTGPLRVEAYDADLNVKTPIVDPIDGVDDISFADGLAQLGEAARKLDAQRDDWYRAPTVSYGSYGPDRLGNCYITIQHTGESVLRSLDTSDLPVELEHILHWEDRPRSNMPEHYDAIYRHERYYQADDDGDDEYADEAAEIGLLGSNIGDRRSITAAFDTEDLNYDQIEELEVEGRRVTIYAYEKGENTRWAVEWSERVKIDEVVWTSLIFDDRPDAEAISQAALIEEARMGGAA